MIYTCIILYRDMLYMYICMYIYIKEWMAEENVMYIKYDIIYYIFIYLF